MTYAFCRILELATMAVQPLISLKRGSHIKIHKKISLNLSSVEWLRNLLEKSVNLRSTITSSQYGLVIKQNLWFKPSYILSLKKRTIPSAPNYLM